MIWVFSETSIWGLPSANIRIPVFNGIAVGFFLGRKSSSPFWVQPAFGRSFPHLGWIHLSDERAVEIFESELFSGQLGKGTGKNKAFHSQFLFKGNLGYLEPKKKTQPWESGIFFGGGVIQCRIRLLFEHLPQAIFPKDSWFFLWKCDRKMAMNFSIRRFISTMRWRRCWRRLSLAFLSAICSYILDLFCWWCFILYHEFHHHHSPPFGNYIFLELFPRISSTNPRYSFLPLSNCSYTVTLPDPPLKHVRHLHPSYICTWDWKTRWFFIDVPYQVGPKTSYTWGLFHNPYK